ncbi:hypothetical protein SAMN05216587_11167 [Selenomonas ruminantium]|uniref:Uncharacterized protein n=2 Tax=Selenomonas ruminantium TaxID=971 RepID=A0A1I0YAL9_SELRU|nr:hypothetical protein SAMN05216587_11167 [Selenomonas ruminantium]
MKEYYVTVKGNFFVAGHDENEAYEKAFEFINENQEDIELEIDGIEKQNWDADEI